MIILNKNWKKGGIILGTAIILVVMAACFIRGNGGEAVNTNAPKNAAENEIDDSISKILSEKEESNFFSEYRMERERIRSKQVEMLKEIMNKESSSQEARDAAALRLVKISEDIEKEMETENLIKSKGYEDSAVIIQEETTTVVILTAALGLDQEEEIKKLVSRSLQCNEETLCIIAREK